MQQQDPADFWNPENHPWLVDQGSPLHEGAFDHGYEDQRALIAEHVATGGSVDTAPYPDIRRYSHRMHRPTLEGIRAARATATDMSRAGMFDAQSILDEVRANEILKEVTDAIVDAGTLEIAADLTSARLHTTVTRLFTDPIVYAVSGDSYAPKYLGSQPIQLRGRLTVGGHRDFDTGLELDGEFKVDLVDAGLDLPGPRDPVMRLMWGAAAAAVGAVHCGEVRAWAGRGGLRTPDIGR